ncbi:DUF2285 domain-containing protein [Bradyrhizobium sp. USDA 3364]
MPTNPKIADLAPSAPEVTPYDEQHAIIYMRLLDAEPDHGDWRDVVRIVFGIDPNLEPDRARLTFESHLARAKWAPRHSYRDLLRPGWTNGEE